MTLKSYSWPTIATAIIGGLLLWPLTCALVWREVRKDPSAGFCWEVAIAGTVVWSGFALLLWDLCR